MTTLRLILRNLTYFRGSALAVIAGMAVATAALAGALMVGDSVRESLKDLAVQRLGQVDYALAGTRFVQQSLAERVAASPKLGGAYDVAPALLITGGASTGDGDARRRTGDVQIGAVGGGWVPVDAGAAILNGETADALGVAGPGDARVIFQLPLMEDAPREAAVARRDVTETTTPLPVDRVAAVARERGMLSLFNLAGGQRVPRNAWVHLADLQNAVGQPGRANALLVHAKSASAENARSAEQLARTSTEAVTALNGALKDVVQLADYGLTLKRAGQTDEASLAAAGTYVPNHAVEAAKRVAAEMGVTPRLVTVNLVNRVVKLPPAGDAAATAPATAPATGPATAAAPATQPAADGLHYVIGAGISALDDGRPLAADEVAFNEVTAAALGVAVGDRVRLHYFKREQAGELREVTSTDEGLSFRVARILPMSGLGADPTLTPEFKGLTDAPSVSDWDPPKELGIVGPNLKLAERDNDAYWKQFKASPRLFVNLDTARKMWGGPYGDVTSVRVPLAAMDAFGGKLRDAIDPAAMGLSFRAVKAEQLAAAGGGTDFGQLFAALSFFLIAAAAMLVAMLFRLGVEQRARQLGLLGALGFGPGRLRRLALAEGMVLATVGALVGLAASVGYTWGMIYGLRTWWRGAVGTTALRLHVEPKTLAIGFAASLVIAFLAVLWGVWRVAKVSPSRLLAGAFATAAARGRRTGVVSRYVGVALVVLGLIVLALVLAGAIEQPETALAGGALLLCGALAWLAGRLRPRRRTDREGTTAAAGLSSVTALGFRNASRHTARSVLSVGLIAFAAFTLITVASMRRTDPEDTGNPKSGAGGYRLILQAGVPLLGDLNTPAGREQLGVRDPADPLWQRARFVPMRRWAGQDISCLNLTRPNSPTILGVATRFDDVPPGDDAPRHRFEFARTVRDVENPWTLLDTETDPNDPAIIPVITDAETAQYILQLPLGGTLPITDQTGTPRKLRLVATLSHSIFQSEMLMSDANFRRLFPAQAGFGTVLVDAPADASSDVRTLLDNELEPYAVSVDTTAARLLAYREIANTYLSTFQALGSLGLALGSIGLAVVLIRNVIERRPELALLAALGFRPGSRVWLVLSENALLLGLGLGVGTACALLGVLPTVLRTGGGIAFGPLALTLLGVLVLGFAASVIAVWASGVRVKPADLRTE